MSDLNLLKKSVVKIPKKSGFDKSFRNLFTTKCGTLTPILCDELIPNTTVNLKLAINCTLPPLASETFMNVNLKAEAFFCPTRLVMPGFNEFIQGKDSVSVGINTGYHIRVPLVKLEASGTTSTDPYIGPGTLADYLGFRSSLDLMTEDKYINCLPFLCYHFIYDNWYKNSLIQGEIFWGKDKLLNAFSWNPSRATVITPCDYSSIGYTVTLNSAFLDGVKLGELRQRNFGTDYFTAATPSAQNGEVQKISMVLPSNLDVISKTGRIDGVYEPSTDDTDMDDFIWNGAISDSSMAQLQNTTIGVHNDNPNNVTPLSLSFTIAALRACNSLQIWEERNLMANGRYVDFLKVQFGADLKDSIAQRPVYLGSASFPVYTKGVYQTASDSNSGNNPFDSVGSRYGHAYAEGTSFIIDHFTAEEPGYLMVLVSLVPEVTYSSGVNSYLLRYRGQSSYGELANPILQNVGQQPINLAEVTDNFDQDTDGYVFGYSDRFCDWMTRVNELHGLMRDGQSLESFALQRNLYGVSWGIGTQFLKIPTDFMDQVTAVDENISNYGVWVDSWLDYKVSMPLARYSVPSLQDPAYEHGQTIVVNRRGCYID